MRNQDEMRARLCGVTPCGHDGTAGCLYRDRFGCAECPHKEWASICPECNGIHNGGENLCSNCSEVLEYNVCE